MKIFLISWIFVSLVFYSGKTFGQAISSDPFLPTEADEVTIYFDASLGNQGLKDFTGDIYAHTGVITDKSTSGSDWKYVIAEWSVNISKAKMTRVSKNLYSLIISPEIRSFYDVPAGDEIQKMAFVFRNEDGTKQGKTTENGDFFLDVFEEGLNINLLNPTEFSVVVELNDQIEVEASATLSNSISLFINNIFITYGDTDSTLTYTIDADTNGEYWVRLEATDGSSFVADSFFYYVRPPVTVDVLPEGMEYGINYINDQTVLLALHAPFKNYVFAIGDFSDWVARADNYMKNTPDGKIWWIELNGLTPGTEYIYQYFVDGTLKIGDPYADKTSDPWNDKWITEETYPGLIEFPEGKTSGIATVLQTAQQAYNWTNTTFISPAEEDLVIYELLIRDFTDQHSYKSLIDTLGYLEKLGVNAIELMPISEFEGNESWGYNPSYYFAPDKYYGPKNDLKVFVDSCHSKGIAVILDMVLNHSYGQNPMVQLYLDHYAADEIISKAESPWFNVSSPNQMYKWGADFNHESDDTRAFVDRVNTYWLSEYKFNGFRFDFTKGFTNTPGDGWAYDPSRINLLIRMMHVIKSVNENAYVILEHLADNTEEKALAGNSMLLWGNTNFNYNEATMGYNDSGKSDFSWISYKKRGWDAPHVVGYMESHDEERLMFKNQAYGNASGSYNIKELNTALSRMELAASFFFTIPGPKMIWQFGELGYDISIDDPCRVCNKPILWEYYQDSHRQRLYQVFSALIDLKKNQEAFTTDNYTLDVAGKHKRINLYHSSMDVVVLGNFDVVSGSLDPNFSKTGKWYEYFSGDSLEVTDPNEAIDLLPGAYRIYTTKRLTPPDIILDVNKPPDTFLGFSAGVFPNPFNGSFNLTIHTEVPTKVNISIYDLSGREISQLASHYTITGTQVLQWDGNTMMGNELESGLYFIKIQSAQGSQVLKVIRQ